jgi:hypothetical protein
MKICDQCYEENGQHAYTCTWAFLTWVDPEGGKVHAA